MYKSNPLTAIDFYKADHRRQYPEGTEYVYSNFTPRSDVRFSWKNKSGKVVFFGLQGFIKAFLIDLWNNEFFNKPKDEVVASYKRRMDTSLGPDSINTKHIEDLHDLGYLPIVIKAVPEGSKVPIGIPVLTIINTKPDFFWLVNYLESVLSTCLWKPCTSATIAYEYKRLVSDYADKTCTNKDHLPFQCHDFSFRGLSGFEDVMSSGSGHLLSFAGTDSIPAIDYLEEYYDANAENELIGASVPATEHSVMCAGGKIDELSTFKRLITEIYPKGIVSIVSDTWDFWKVLDEYLPTLKEDIMKRDGTVVIRPDSGDPVNIICGDIESESKTEFKGLIESLWDIFGGTINDKGYKVLDTHIGAIYGDSITLDRANNILSRLEAKGFASSNIVFGIGSFTYQYNTRDTFGFAMKATWCQVKGVTNDLFKDPITDNGEKKSAKGLLVVEDNFTLSQCVTPTEEQTGMLSHVFKDGELTLDISLGEIRKNLEQS